MDKEKIKYHAEQIIKLVGDQPPPPEKQLRAVGKKIYYGDEPVHLGGNSWRHILRAEVGLAGKLPLNLADYEKKCGESGQNFVRHDCVPNASFVRDHCLRMREKGIFVQLTFGEGSGKPLYCNPHEIIAATRDIGTIIYDPVNELYCLEDCNVAWWWCNWMFNNGKLLSAAGAIGNGGEEWEKRFFKGDSSGNMTAAMINLHRHYENKTIAQQWIRRYDSWDRPRIRTEIIGLTKDQAEAIARADRQAGAVGFNFFDDYFDLAGRLCQEFNR